MKVFLLVKKRGAPQSEWKIHLRIKRGWRHSTKKANSLRKQLGSKFVVKMFCPYYGPIKKNGITFLQPLENESLEQKNLVAEAWEEKEMRANAFLGTNSSF
jgi:hypothetical protein